MKRIRLLMWFALLAAAAHSFSQARPVSPRYGDLNTFSIFAEYANDSSHILLGSAEDRKLLNFGVAYSRRLFATRLVDFRYMAELRPLMLEGDPVTTEIIDRTMPPPSLTVTGSGVTVQACHPNISDFSYIYQGVTYAGTVTDTCSRQWTFGEGFSPAGMRLNLLPRKRLEPVFTASGGYIFTTKPIPIASAGSANFTFEFGAGVEFFRSSTRSVRIEYRYDHISNNYSAYNNPGIDSGMLQMSYSFGR